MKGVVVCILLVVLVSTAGCVGPPQDPADSAARTTTAADTEPEAESRNSTFPQRTNLGEIVVYGGDMPAAYTLTGANRTPSSGPNTPAGLLKSHARQFRRDSSYDGPRRVHVRGELYRNSSAAQARIQSERERYRTRGADIDTGRLGFREETDEVPRIRFEADDGAAAVLLMRQRENLVLFVTTFGDGESYPEMASALLVLMDSAAEAQQGGGPSDDPE